LGWLQENFLPFGTPKPPENANYMFDAELIGGLHLSRNKFLATNRAR
jgi:hypothetical protein